jgi:hypothetical protein
VIWGQRSRALARRRCSRDAFVESGYLATAIIFHDGVRDLGVSRRGLAFGYGTKIRCL